MRALLLYIVLGVFAFVIGLLVAFVLDGFVWTGLEENFGTGVGATVGGLICYYVSTRKKKT